MSDVDFLASVLEASRQIVASGRAWMVVERPKEQMFLRVGLLGDSSPKSRAWVSRDGRAFAIFRASEVIEWVKSAKTVETKLICR